MDEVLWPKRPRVPPVPDTWSPRGQGVVAPGRTVEAAGDEMTVAGYDDDGAPIYRPKLRAFVAGEMVDLPAAEIAHLTEAGFLLPPASP